MIGAESQFDADNGIAAKTSVESVAIPESNGMGMPEVSSTDNAAPAIADTESPATAPEATTKEEALQKTVEAMQAQMTLVLDALQRQKENHEKLAGAYIDLNRRFVQGEVARTKNAQALAETAFDLKEVVRKSATAANESESSAMRDIYNRLVTNLHAINPDVKLQR